MYAQAPLPTGNIEVYDHCYTAHHAPIHHGISHHESHHSGHHGGHYGGHHGGHHGGQHHEIDFDCGHCGDICHCGGHGHHSAGIIGIILVVAIFVLILFSFK